MGGQLGSGSVAVEGQPLYLPLLIPNPLPPSPRLPIPSATRPFQHKVRRGSVQDIPKDLRNRLYLQITRRMENAAQGNDEEIPKAVAQKYKDIKTNDKAASCQGEDRTAVEIEVGRVIPSSAAQNQGAGRTGCTGRSMTVAPVVFWP